MEINNLPHRDVLTRHTAAAYHRRLKQDHAPILEMGRFYLSMVERNVWPSQTAMALELGVSIFQISRRISAARLPESVLALFATKTALSFSHVATLQKLLKEFGEAEIVNRSNSVSSGASTSEILSILATEKGSSPNGVRISRVKGQRYLRLDIPNVAEIAPYLEKIEQMLNLLLSAGGASTWGHRSKLDRSAGASARTAGSERKSQ
ncbi:hypothetical protein [Paraburkholderia sp. GAS32]|uniref:hypothetical protein n=1 Tax=Paraburkholderia sp. GAS32 TaxID=3035129 RepID=UPI003D24A713